MTAKTKVETPHFQPLELADCKVPIGCPWGCDCPEDAFPDHHGGGGGGGGCFLAGTPVNIGSDTYRPIEALQAGDSVLSFDEQTGALESNPVTRLYKTEQPQYYVLNGRIRTTGTHPFRVNGKWIPVAKIKVGDVLQNVGNEPVPVESIDVVDKPVEVYNLTVGKAHTFFVDGVLVHNKPPVEEPPSA